jgi:subtilisin family serine protease
VAPGRVLVTLAPGLRAASLDGALRARGLRLGSVVDGAGVAVVDTAGQPVDAAVAALQGAPGITSASPDYVRTAAGAPDDPLYAPHQRAHARAVRLLPAWDRTTGSPDVVVAVLDTGIHFRHPDLLGKVLPGWDAVDDDPSPVDDNGHGTFVAGIAGARASNGEGVAGVASGSPLLPVKVLDQDGQGTDADIIEGIVWAADHGADVLNLSLSGPGRSAALDAAVRYAVDRDVVVVAASGDHGSEIPEYPAASPGAVSVGATDADGRLAHFSSWGDTVDLVAPGMDVASTALGGGYAKGDGTSFSAPLVAGVATLLRSVEPDLAARDVGNRVVNSSKDIGAQGRDPQTGRGLLDAAASLGAKLRQPVAVPDRAASDAPGNARGATDLWSLSATERISPEGDVDWFSYDMRAEWSTIGLAVTPPPVATGERAAELDPVVAVYGPGNQLLGTADTAGPGEVEVLDVPTQGHGRYRFEVRNRLATTSPDTYTVALRGAGADANHVFEDEATYPAPGVDLDSVAVADVTGDGRQDVLATRSYPPGPGTLYVFPQGPDGRLASPLAHATTGDARDVDTGDIDGDGDPDVVVAAGNGVDVFLQGAAGLASPTHTATGGSEHPHLVDIGDIDGDGDGDLVVVDSGYRLILARRGSSGFALRTLEQGNQLEDVELGDLDGDGADEAVRLGCEDPGPCNVVAVHERSPTGTYTRTVHRAHYALNSAESVSIADLTGDGRLDVAAGFGGTEASSRIEVFRQTATGLGAPVVHDVSWRNPAALEAGDVDGNGTTDLVTVHDVQLVMGVLRQSGGQLAGEEVQEIGSHQVHPGSLAVGDVTGDGRADAVVADGPVRVLAQRPTAPPPRLPDLWMVGPGPADLATGVDPGARISVEAARPLQPSTVRAGQTVRLVGGVTGREVPATVAWDPAHNTIRITPAAPLRRGLPYVVRIRGVRDLGGATMEGLFRSRFTVAA